MIHRLATEIRRQSIGCLALFIALGATSYAAITIPAGSVGARQLRNHSITPVKFDPAAIGGSVRAWAYVSAAGKVYSAHGVKGVFHTNSEPSQYGVSLLTSTVHGCAATASVVADQSGGTTAGPGSALTGLSAIHTPSGAEVETFNAAGQATPLPFVVEVLC